MDKALIMNEIERQKRQAESAENQDGPNDPFADDVQNIWEGMMKTMVNGAKEIAKKVMESFAGEDPEQPRESS